MADGSVKEYRYPPRRKERADTPFGPDSVGALIEAYKISPEWVRLAPKTREVYAIYIGDLQRDPHAKVKSVTRRDLLAVRDAIAITRGPGAATGFVRAAAAVFGWAVDREWIEHAPTARLKVLPGGHLPAWTNEQAGIALQNLLEPLRRVVMLALHTGQRRGDLVRMTWADYDGTSIRLRQEKTGTPLVIPAHPDLKAELDSWRPKTTAVTILTNQVGKPWDAGRLSDMMARALARIDGMPPHLNVHGLRKLAATRLADAGCSTHEIAAVTGHRTLGMVALYTQSADQEKLASAAIHRLTPASNKPKRKLQTMSGK